MKIISLFNPKKTKNHFLALDIDNEIIRAIFLKKEKEKIIIIKTFLEPIERPELKDNFNLWADLVKKAVFKIINEIKEKVQTTILLKLPARLLKVELIFYYLIRNNPKVKIKKEEETKIYHEVLIGAKKEIANQFFKSFGILPEDLEFIKLDICETKIDGYTVPQLSGFKGQELSFKIMALFSPKYYLEPFKDFKIVHLIEGLKKIFDEGIFIEINDDLTQIFIIKERNLSYFSEIPIGGNDFKKLLSQDLGISEKMAENLKEKYSQKLISEESRQKIKSIFNTLSQKWFLEFISKLKESKIFPLPSNVYLIGPESTFPDIKEKIEDIEDWNFKVFNIALEDFKNIEDKTKSLNNFQFIPSLLICYTLL